MKRLLITVCSILGIQALSSAAPIGTIQDNQTATPQTATVFVTSGTVDQTFAISGTNQSGTTPVFRVMGSTLNITAAGRVGIGIAAPAALLDVFASTGLAGIKFTGAQSSPTASGNGSAAAAAMNITGATGQAAGGSSQVRGGAGGALTLTSGTGGQNTSSNVTAGALYLAGNGGTISVSAGSGGAGSVGASKGGGGGGINLNAGNGGASDGAAAGGGGSLSFSAGFGGTANSTANSGVGGSATFQGGTGGTNSTSGGQAGAGGTAIIVSGTGGTGFSGANGANSGNVTIDVGTPGGNGGGGGTAGSIGSILIGQSATNASSIISIGLPTSTETVYGYSNFNGQVNISSPVLLSGASGTNGQIFTSGGSGTIPTWTTVSGTGDMILASTQTVTGAKTQTSPSGSVVTYGIVAASAAFTSRTSYGINVTSNVIFQGTTFYANGDAVINNASLFANAATTGPYLGLTVNTATPTFIINSIGIQPGLNQTRCLYDYLFPNGQLMDQIQVTGERDHYLGATQTYPLDQWWGYNSANPGAPPLFEAITSSGTHFFYGQGSTDTIHVVNTSGQLSAYVDSSGGLHWNGTAAFPTPGNFFNASVNNGNFYRGDPAGTAQAQGYNLFGSTQQWTGSNSYVSSTTFQGAVVMSSGVYISTVGVTGNYTALSTGTVVFANCSSACTVTLPTAVSASGLIYYVKTLGAGVVTVATTSSQTIDGATTQVMGIQYTTLEVISDGSNWNIL